MQSTLIDTRFERAFSNNAAVENDELVRKGELDAALSGVAPLVHQHESSDVTDFDAAVQGVIGLYIADGDTVEWFDDGGFRKARVVLKTDGGLLADGDGVYVNTGSGVGQIATADYARELAHDPVTVTDGTTVDLSLSAQVLTAEVIRATNSGLEVSDGLGVKFGTSHFDVPYGDHTHSGIGHPEVTVLPSPSLFLEIDEDQVLTGAVTLDPDPAPGRAFIESGGAGLYVPLGTESNKAAAGDHVHSAATSSTNGLMSLADKRKLDRFNDLAQVDQVVTFHRSDVAPVESRVGGQVFWNQAMQVLSANVCATPGSGQVVFGLRQNGNIVGSLSIAGGTVPSTVTALALFDELYVVAEDIVDWVVQSGIGVLEEEASDIDISLNVRPALASLDTVAFNSGGLAETPFSADAYYDSGAEVDTTTTIDLSAVTDPAPMAVYKSARAKYYNSDPLIYTITGLARGIYYNVRCHFAEFTWTDVGRQQFDLTIVGNETVGPGFYDILAETSGVQFKAVISESLVKPDSAGQIVVKLQPLLSAFDEYHCSINGIELVPQV